MKIKIAIANRVIWIKTLCKLTAVNTQLITYLNRSNILT